MVGAERTFKLELDDLSVSVPDMAKMRCILPSRFIPELNRPMQDSKRRNLINKVDYCGPVCAV